MHIFQVVCFYDYVPDLKKKCFALFTNGMGIAVIPKSW